MKDWEKQMPPHHRPLEELCGLEQTLLLSILTVWILRTSVCYFTTEAASLRHKAGPSSAATAFVPGGCGQAVQAAALSAVLL